MKLFSTYLLQRRKEIVIFTMFAVIFMVTFALYRLPLKAVLYPAGLCGMAGICFLIADFLCVRKKHEKLLVLTKDTENIMDMLPEAYEMEEKDYQNIIEELYIKQKKLVTQMDCRYYDMIEYYTIWAHQIKTPIASMRLKLQNEDSVLTRKLSSDLLRVEQYVDMVLTFLRLGSDTTDYVFKECSADEIIKTAVKKFRSEFIDRKLKLIYEPSDMMVISDEKWLSFVVEQVISNALKYTPQGSITIYTKEPGKLYIKDTGIGIAAEDMPRIFENGYTGYNGRSNKKASGIGLYLCRRICNNLGHTITAESVPDEGTEICISLEQTRLQVE